MVAKPKLAKEGQQQELRSIRQTKMDVGDREKHIGGIDRVLVGYLVWVPLPHKEFTVHAWTTWSREIQ